MAFVGADDIPSAGQNKVFDDVLFAADRVNYVGQRLGLVVATSQVSCATHVHNVCIVPAIVRLLVDSQRVVILAGRRSLCQHTVMWSYPHRGRGSLSAHSRLQYFCQLPLGLHKGLAYG